MSTVFTHLKDYIIDAIIVVFIFAIIVGVGVFSYYQIQIVSIKPAGRLETVSYNPGGVLMADSTVVITNIGYYAVSGAFVGNKEEELTLKTKRNGDKVLCKQDGECWTVLGR